MKKNTNTIKAIAGHQLSEEQIQAFVTHFNTKGSIPGNKIICTDSGKLTTCVGPWRAKKIKEYGTLENLLRNYKCRGVNKKINEVKIKGIPKAKKEKEEKVYDIPQMKNTVRGPITGKALTEHSKTACMRPDVFLDNGRHCYECPHFEVCSNNLKCLTKGFAFTNGEFVEV